MQSQSTIIFIAGWGRSGTTLLGNLLASKFSGLMVGEVRYLWDRGLEQKKICGCTQRVVDCELWMNSVPEEAMILPNLMSRKVGSRARLLQLLNFLPGGQYIYRSLCGRELNLLNLLYANLLDSAPNNVLVDTSKSPFYATSLALSTENRIRFIHIVRNPAGVAFSWQRVKQTLDSEHGKDEFPRYGIVRSSIQWLVVNILCMWCRVMPNVEYCKLFYEDLVANPTVEIERLANFIGLDDNQEGRCSNHSVSGNPIRFVDVRELKMHPDTEWKTGLPFYKKALIAVLTFPGRLLGLK